ncbi:S-methyl-5'-thioadenosine phosphorylase [Exophiala sideris]|uniref:S-methyl-5'-thioadenosine phosphorylase n=1 Tax=Exophiala sideris TaxID=1016849 RepID=A0A0D1YKW2_9EURO|nr:S-methyl-5'-thioadenosine phosphorylase [Exophiala sideris]
MSSENVPTSYSAPIHIGVIGGTGLDTLPGFHKAAVLDIDTPWGKPSSDVTVLEHPSPTTGKPIPIAFLARHGIHHQHNPTEIPVRANIAAFRKLGVRCIIAFSAAGSLAEEVKPRDFVVPDQVIDRTKGIRPFTFFEGGFVLHVPFADPFDKRVGDVVRKCGHSLEGEGVVLHDKGTVIVMEGPQFSTRAESNMYRSWGGTVINMSTLPEAKLAAEAEIAYQVILMSTDYDCWHDSGDVSVEMVMGHMRANALNARRFIGSVLDELSKEEHAELVQAKHLAGGREFGISTYPAGRSPETLKKLKWLFEGYFEE